MNLSPDARKALLADIKGFFKKTLDQDIGDLKAILVLDFVLEAVGPAVYNQALVDAEAFLRARLDDLEPSLSKPLPIPDREQRP